MRYKKKYIIIPVLLLTACLGLIFFYGIEDEGHETVVQDSISVKDIRQTSESTADSIQHLIPEVKRVEEKAQRTLLNKPQTAIVVQETPLEEEVLSSDTVIAPLKLGGTICSLVEKESRNIKLLPDHVVVNNDKEFDWKADTLETKRGIDLLRIKRVGRFDRGIVNYRFMPKGRWMFGTDFSFWDYNSEDSKLLFTYLDDFDFDARTITVSPFIGYFFKDNQAVGMKFGYKHTDGHLGNVSFKIDDDVNFTLKELKLNEDMYNFTFFHSSYIGLDAGKRFGLFNETNLRLGFGHSEFSRGSGESLKNTKTNIFEAQIGINPGVAVFIMQNVSVECSVGVIGLKYRKESQVNNLGERGARTNGGANFKINLFDINLGLTISM